MPIFFACGGLNDHFRRVYPLLQGENAKKSPAAHRRFIFRGESPPQAENFGILDPLNDDFQRENGPPEAKFLAKSGPKPKEPPPR